MKTPLEEAILGVNLIVNKANKFYPRLKLQFIKGDKPMELYAQTIGIIASFEMYNKIMIEQEVDKFIYSEIDSHIFNTLNNQLYGFNGTFLYLITQPNVTTSRE